MSKKSKRMYQERKENIGIVEGCQFNCIYCQFRIIQKRFGTKKEDIEYIPHIHSERFDKKPKFTTGDEFITIGLNGDISYVTDGIMLKIIEYCNLWKDRTFLLQSKNPERFLDFEYPDNVILGATVETNRSEIWDNTPYSLISKAPEPYERLFAMSKLINNRTFVTMEPILEFDPHTMIYWLKKIAPEAVYIGYDSGNFKLPEPKLSDTLNFIEGMKEAGLNIRTKLMRPAWHETSKTQNISFKKELHETQKTPSIVCLPHYSIDNIEISIVTCRSCGNQIKANPCDLSLFDNGQICCKNPDYYWTQVTGASI